MPLGNLDGVGLGCKAEVSEGQPEVFPDESWLGRVVNALGEPIDGKGPLLNGKVGIPIRNNPPPAHSRRRVGGKIDLGVRAMNTFLSCCRGQRMGIFAGSGVGKSVLMSMLARYMSVDVNVIGLIGERGREVQEFITEDLGEDGMARSVVVVATSDEAPLMRRQSAYMTMSIAEYFRDQGKNVMCMMDSVTRFAMAQREIGLSAGEPPTTKGYPPTDLRRTAAAAGARRSRSSATATSPACSRCWWMATTTTSRSPTPCAASWTATSSWSARSASAGAIPPSMSCAVVSRTMPGCNTDQENALVGRARRLLSAYDDMAEMIRLGAYRAGAATRWSMRRSSIIRRSRNS